MKSIRLHQINIGLIFLSALLAYLLPFRLFLFSYAVLGPLHYLTEISWLHKRKYYLVSKKNAGILWGLGLLIFFDRIFFQLPVYFGAGIIFSALLVAIIMVMKPKKGALRTGLFFGVVVLAFLLAENTVYLVVFGSLLSTLIHVFVFTTCFMFYGALKERSTMGYISTIVLICTALSFFILPSYSVYFQVSEYISLNYSSFSGITTALRSFLGFGEVESIFSSKEVFPFLRFIAFAYTYHYLNWFSKTSVIGWHKVSLKNISVVLILWGLSLSIYLYDYQLGLSYLYLLSMSHVFLEFPLNYRSISGIINEVSNIRNTNNQKKEYA